MGSADCVADQEASIVNTEKVKGNLVATKRQPP